jgi:hypothetical protein
LKVPGKLPGIFIPQALVAGAGLQFPVDARWSRRPPSENTELRLAMIGGCKLYGPDGFRVTCLFNRAQGIQYIDRIVADFTVRGVVFADLLGEVAA